MAYKIIVDDNCIKCGTCVSVCDNFKLGDEKAYPVSETIDEIGDNDDAKEMCPVRAISLEEI